MKYNLRKRAPPPPPDSSSSSSSSSGVSYVPPSKKQKLPSQYAEILKNYTPVEGKYFNSLSPSEAADILCIEEKLKNSLNSINEVPIRFQIVNADIDEATKILLLNKIDRFNKMTSDYSEYYKFKNWIDSASMIPFNKYKDMPVSKDDPREKILDFMSNTKKILDNTVYGHIEAKQNIQRIIAQWISNPTSHGYCIGIHGPPGIGKTCLIKDGLSKALGLPFGFVALGGVSDGAYLTGYNYTYEGSTYGKIAEIVMKSRCMNPIIFFDELDKICLSHKGDEINGILTHLTDVSQNDSFTDRYFSEISLNLSRSLIVFSYNNASTINPILKDRMITIEVKGYNRKEKLTIARDYLLPSILETFKIKKEDIILTDAIIEKIIGIVEKEEGVRNLKRGIESVISWINMYTYTREVNITYPYVVSSEFVEKHTLRTTNKDTAILNRMYL